MHRTIRDFIFDLSPHLAPLNCPDQPEPAYYNDWSEPLEFMHNYVSDMRFITNTMLVSLILPTIKPHIILLLLHMPTRVWYHEERESPTP